ncbi:peptide ABC transporter substrate-binding protein [Chloroflexota bacterium]
MKRTIYTIFSILLICSLLAYLIPTAVCKPRLNAPAILSKENSLSLYGIDPLTLDPAVSSEMTSLDYIIQLFSGLVRLDDNLEPESDIADRWEISDDGKTYTFYLRKEAKFHNGKEVKADDFKYSWERACNPGIRSMTASTYLGDIVGVKEMLAGINKELSGVRVIDDYILSVTTDAPKSYFLAKLSYPTAFVVDRENVKSGKDWWRTPNGTGPFKFRQWNESELFVLEKNELYHGEKASIDYVIFRLWGGRPMNMYETGEIDINQVYIDYIDKVIDKAGPLHKELVIFPELSLSYIGFNCSKPPFDDVNIRRAFSHAIDKNKMVDLIYRDMKQRADGILPPGIPGFNENLSGLNYDVDKAKKLIKESGYGDVSELPPITITTQGRGGYISPDLEAIIYQWRQNMGVDVKVRQLEPERYFYYLKQEKDELFDMGWIADYPHPQDFLEILFHSEAENNYGEYVNLEVDNLLERAGVESDSELSLALYRRAEQLLVEDAACLPLWFGKNYVLRKPHVKGYNLNALGIATLNKVSIEGK